MAACGEPSVPAAVPPAAYVTGMVCAECHAEHVQEWTGSDHDRAMAPATLANVLGDFENVTFRHKGVSTRFFRQDSTYWVETQGPTGQTEVFQVRYTFGVDPLQQYLIAFPDGRLQALTTAWDTRQNRWFALFPDEDAPPEDFLHWTGAGMNWNYMCAACHSTDLQRNFDLASNTYTTSYSDVDVNCEACHGPGEAHVQWARQPESNRSATTNLGLTVPRSDTLHNQHQIDTCAPCHSRRREIAPGFQPGRSFLDYFQPSLLEEDLYFPDGQIKDEVYVYGSFLQSKMHQVGVRCTDCHNPHTAQVKFAGNALCTQCHAPATFDALIHHFHPDGPGSACVDCHMPARTYMEIDPRRDHSFKIPRPDLADLGIPNVCTSCHADQTSAWAASQIAQRFAPGRATQDPVTGILAAGQQQAPQADSLLTSLIHRSDAADITRASAVALLGRYDSPLADQTLRAALTDPAPLVRMAAVQSWNAAPDDRLYEALAPRLSDSVRVVRIEAARLLSRVAERYFRTRDTDRARPYWAALAEYETSLDNNNDQPAAHLNRALLKEQLNAPNEALKAYRTALRLDSAYIPAHVNLAMLLNRNRMAALQAGQTQEATRLFAESEAALRTAVRLQPEVADLKYTLGLLLAEDQGRLPESAQILSEAARLAPDNPRMHYNAGLAYQHLKQYADAEPLLVQAHELAPQQPDYLNALAIFYMQQEKWQPALKYTEALIQVLPAPPPALLQQQSYLKLKVDR